MASTCARFPAFAEYFGLHVDDPASPVHAGGQELPSEQPPRVHAAPSSGFHVANISRLPHSGLLPLLELPAKGDDCQSESVIKRAKLATFEKQCSRVADGLYVSGEQVAKSRELLRQHGITHVVNCVGAMYGEFFKDDGVAYKTLWLTDLPSEDILCVLYDAFDFIEEARCACPSSAGCCSSSGDGTTPRRSSHGGGSVLVHCSQGVSRSTTLAIGYLMWKTGQTYDEAYRAVRALRGVASPNIGFTCQLLQWQKRREQAPATARAFHIRPQCSTTPEYLVPKIVQPGQLAARGDVCAALDPGSCYVIHTSQQVYVWQGLSCPQAHAQAGVRAAQQLQRYEEAPPPQLVPQGAEPPELWAALYASAQEASRPSRTTSVVEAAHAAVGSDTSPVVAGGADSGMQLQGG